MDDADATPLDPQPPHKPKVPLPKLDVRAADIKKALDVAVVGQEEAKVRLSVLFSMRCSWVTKPEHSHPPPNALVLGPTGSGKTHALRTIASYIGLPFIVVDATSLAPTSFQGMQLTDVLRDLYFAANEDAALAQKGVVFIDEFDKLAFPSAEDVGGRHLRHMQRSLLKLIEGVTVTVPLSPLSGTTVSLDTTGILFICGGAFTGVQDYAVRRRRPPEIARKLANQNDVISADIVSFGFIPELIARLPVLVQFQSLGVKELRAILDNPVVTPCQVWRTHFAAIGKDLLFEPEALDVVARSAVDLDMGARGLAQVIFSAMASRAFEMEATQDKVCRFTSADIRQRVSTLEAARSPTPGTEGE
jgi:ATP-dependent Clp protease ATP-binding subunit ClpX